MNDASAQVPAIGPIGPRPDGVDAPYWDGLEHGELRIQRCATCRRWIWAPVWRCGRCGSWELAWEAVEPTGRVFSWVTTWQAFVPDMAGALPYTTVLVELPAADSVRLLGILVGNDSGLSIGAGVEGVLQPPGPLTNNRPVMRWRLK